MCKSCAETISASTSLEKKYRLSDFFDAHWEEYLKSPSEPIQPEQFKAVNAMRVCRTPALGVDIYACENCGDITEVYHSCKNRFCPTCSWQDTIKWAEKTKYGMFNLPHRHAVFTLPHQLHNLIKRNKEQMLNILLRTSADTLKDWLLAKYKLKCGIISVLHTFGEKKDNHFHTHMIVSWGGIEVKTGLLKKIENDYINYEFLKKKFRIKFEDALVKMYTKGELEHSFTDEIDFKQYLKKINEKSWVVQIEPPMADPEAVIRYIGRYSKRACLSEYKITEMEGDYISFRYKNYKKLDENKKPIEEILRLHYRDFFPRLLQHVPLPYFRIVRYYGYYSNKSRIPQEYLFQQSTEEMSGGGDWETLQLEKQGENPLECKKCQKRKVYQFTVFINKQNNQKVYVRLQLQKRDQEKRNAA